MDSAKVSALSPQRSLELYKQSLLSFYIAFVFQALILMLTSQSITQSLKSKPTYLPRTESYYYYSKLFQLEHAAALEISRKGSQHSLDPSI